MSPADDECGPSDAQLADDMAARAQLLRDANINPAQALPPIT